MYWVHVHPQGGEKKLGPNLQGKVVNAPPSRECTPEAYQESICGGNCGYLGGGRGYLGSFRACVLRATTKKGRQLFRERKVHPRQNPCYAYDPPDGVTRAVRGPPPPSLVTPLGMWMLSMDSIAEFVDQFSRRSYDLLMVLFA